ncbi:hypothetical protein FPANT_8916 [Fusarium pseudoanthophilum]|uniref:Oxidase ustYa n=1 Tax=Fusarium pseudoanthophilum TaxID=48495 RepID=A0A8H5KXY7_9HYPO|nr:hypothetical protein FPANT_8916 [Fusarium pseudoanthophilum]
MWKRCKWFIDTTLLFLIFILLLTVLSFKQEAPSFQTVGDVTGFVPKFSHRITTFTPDPDFFPDDAKKFFTNATRNKWLSLVPGYLHIQRPEEYNNLPTPLLNYEKKDMFVVTTSYSIAHGYALLATGQEGKQGEAHWHMNHCFDYLRQSIMCAGDVALEGQQTTFAKAIPGSDGWDAMHNCRNYNEVFQFLERHKALKEHWI